MAVDATLAPSGLPIVVMGILRFDWQIECVRETDGVVLNIGCNEDYGQLRRRFGVRVVNCDLTGYDEHEQRFNRVDRIFNCLEMPWPFADDSAELVVLGDILEHFTVPDIVRVLAEARRVAGRVCVTVPEDTRIDPVTAAEAYESDGVDAYHWHTTVFTRGVLDDVLARSGWEPLEVFSGDWGFDPSEGGITGWCALAERV